MSYRRIVALAAVLLVLAAGAFSQAATEAAPPDPYAGLDGSVVLTTDCMAIVSWADLRGGKPLYIQMRLSYNDGGGDGDLNDFVPSLAEGANGIYKVRQDDGHFELDLSGPAGADPLTLHRITVRFEDRRGAVLGPVASYQAEADCARS